MRVLIRVAKVRKLFIPYYSYTPPKKGALDHKRQNLQLSLRHFIADFTPVLTSVQQIEATSEKFMGSI